jgi:two-component system, NarL family, nitrate/nitrite response regulator NarL
VILVSPFCLFADSLGRALRTSRVATLVGIAHAADDIAGVIGIGNAPDVSIVDAAIGIAAIRSIVADAQQTPVLLVGVRAREVAAFLTLGASGYLTEDAGLPELTRAISCVSIGESYCSIGAARALAEHVRARPHAGYNELTRREEQIVALVSQGLSNKEIAQELTIELQTVKNHVHSALRKLGFSSRRHLARGSGAAGESQVIGSMLVPQSVRLY